MQCVLDLAMLVDVHYRSFEQNGICITQWNRLIKCVRLQFQCAAVSGQATFSMFTITDRFLTFTDT